MAQHGAEAPSQPVEAAMKLSTRIWSARTWARGKSAMSMKALSTSW
jgi:hypothetical protein